LQITKVLMVHAKELIKIYLFYKDVSQIILLNYHREIA